MSDANAAILVVEDEAHLAAGLKLNFELDGYEVIVASTGREGAAALAAQRFKAPHAGRFAHQPYPFQRKAPSSDRAENGLKAISQIQPSGARK